VNIFELLNRLIDCVELYVLACERGHPTNAQSEMENAKTAIIEAFAILEAELKSETAWAEEYHLQVEKLEIENRNLKEKCENDFTF
jgi:hypothetical protein